MSLSIHIADVFAFIIAFAVFMYIVMDGFDLGIGMLFPFFPKKEDRNIIMNTVAPVWDGNETWLVLGGGGLFAAFPLAFGIVMPAIYTPIIAMLIGLIFRGVAFEFRWRSQRERNLWDIAFAGGSLLAAMAQGVALGAILQGVTVSGRHYGGGWWDWLTPFSLLTGLSVVAGYSLLGATWLLMKTDGDLRHEAYRLARILAIATVIAICAVSLATPFLKNDYWRRWFEWPGMLFTSPIPLAVAAITYFLLKNLADRHDYRPFLLSLALFALCFAGLGVSMWPYIVPQSITIREAAAPDNSLYFMIVGIVVLVPIILAYTAFSYWVFRGKVDAKSGYHS